MGSVGDCYDIAMAESFFATLETELIDQQPRRCFRDREQAQSMILTILKGFTIPFAYTRLWVSNRRLSMKLVITVRSRKYTTHYTGTKKTPIRAAHYLECATLSESSKLIT